MFSQFLLFLPPEIEQICLVFLNLKDFSNAEATKNSPSNQAHSIYALTVEKSEKKILKLLSCVTTRIYKSNHIQYCHKE